MFVCSTAQFHRLLLVRDETDEAQSMLDVGAGDGYVTRELAPLFDSVTATETSPLMAWRLRSAGFESISADDLNDEALHNRKFNCVSCLNVLDR